MIYYMMMQLVGKIIENGRCPSARLITWADKWSGMLVGGTGRNATIRIRTSTGRLQAVGGNKNTTAKHI